MSSYHVRDAYAEPNRARVADRFTVCGLTGWMWGIAPWAVFVFFAQPIVSAIYHGDFEPAPPAMWAAAGLYWLLILVVLPAWAAYASWNSCFVIRAAPDSLTVGRWFGIRKEVYRPNDIVTWRVGDWRWRAGRDRKRAWKIRIDISDGSCLRLSRTAWNFRKLEEWLRRSADGKDRPATVVSHAADATYHLIVRDVRLMLIGLTAWVVMWIITAVSVDAILSGRIVTPSKPGDVAAYVLRLVLDLLTFTLGPLAGYIAFKDVRVHGSRIDVVRWFGLRRRTYHEGDIKVWHVSLDPNPPWWRETREARLELRFTDGAGVAVLGHSANFEGLHQYLRARAPSREQAPPIRWWDERHKRAIA